MCTKSRQGGPRYHCPTCGGWTMIDFEFKDLYIDTSVRCEECGKTTFLGTVGLEDYAHEELNASEWKV